MRLDFFGLEWFFVCSKPRVTSDVDSLCNDFVYAVQIPGLSSGSGSVSASDLLYNSGENHFCPLCVFQLENGSDP